MSDMKQSAYGLQAEWEARSLEPVRGDVQNVLWRFRLMQYGLVTLIAFKVPLRDVHIDPGKAEFVS
jgi:hypothetical protein